MNKPRLIDANELVIETKKCLSLCQTFKGYTAEDALEHFLLLIDDQPTAYNLDRVVEQLEEKIEENPYCSLANYRAGLFEAIEIVKGGQNA